MIRQICPHCQRLAELPDISAGSSVPCPYCSQMIAVPAAYTPSVAPGGGLGSTTENPAPPIPAPPPGLNLNAFTPETTPRPQPNSTEFHPCWSIALRPAWLDWIPAACLTIVLILTFFAWIGSYPGGVRIYSQNPWTALVGSLDIGSLPESLQAEEKEVKSHLTGNRWLIAYLPLLLITVVFAWIERLIRQQPNPLNLPGPLAWLPGIWPKRHAILLALCTALFVLLTVQVWSGFGLENAVSKKVEEAYREETSKAETVPEKQKLAIRMGREIAAYTVSETTAGWLAYWCQFAAFATMLGRVWLIRRGDKPVPRISVEC